eukprot:475099-Prymnesium_polylepis.1
MSPAQNTWGGGRAGRGSVISHKYPLRHIVPLRVPCFSVLTLLSRHSVSPHQLAVLTVDAESSDLDILEAVPWDRISPRLLMWETSRELDDHSQCAQPLTNRTLDFIALLEAQHGHACSTASGNLENAQCVARKGVPRECTPVMDAATRRWRYLRAGCRWGAVYHRCTRPHARGEQLGLVLLLAPRVLAV